MKRLAISIIRSVSARTIVRFTSCACRALSIGLGLMSLCKASAQDCTPPPSIYALQLSDPHKPIQVTLGGIRTLTAQFVWKPALGDKPYTCLDKYDVDNSINWSIDDASIVATSGCTGNKTCALSGSALGHTLLHVSAVFPGADVPTLLLRDIVVVNPPSPPMACVDQSGQTVACGGGCLSNSVSASVVGRSAASNPTLQVSLSCHPKDFPAEIITSGDPNDKGGVQGAGSNHFVTAATLLVYPISYGNEATASASAQTVIIIDPLNTATDDLSTFTFGPISVAGQTLFPPQGTAYATTVDMRPGTNLLVGVNAQLDTSTGIATWKFTSIDPSTGLPTTNPAAGFLPPGANGSVFFTVMPKQNVTSGTKVQNQATIVFDGNPPMSTPTWLNTFDVTLPTSKVQPLPATEAASSFPVSWTGTDADSGVQDYTIYVSVDGGAFSAWLTKTTATSATFTGQAGHTYAFYSIAEDNVGNIEAAKTAAEASTQVVTAPQCTNSINYANGFTGNGLTLNGGATISGSALQLTDGGTYEARSAFYPAAVPIDNFVTDFTFQLTNAQADGFTFVVQTNSPQALGGGGPGLGYVGIPSSAALKFDLYNNAGEGTSSTGFYLDGTYPTKPSFDLLSKGIDLHSGHIFAAHLVYNGTLVTATITDTVTQTSVTLTDRIPPKAPGGLAYLGFTGATGKLSATQNILTWTYSSTLPCPVQ